jgi:hypothetical protein
MSDYPQSACRSDWERNPQTDDGHAHDWHMVITEPYPGRRDPMTICRICTAPRCGHTFDDDPCLERRHHTGMHIHESGRFRPLGDILPPLCTCGHEDEPYANHVLPCEVADLHQRRERIRIREQARRRAEENR